jgi:hypothetical protein
MNYIGRCDPVPHDSDPVESTESDHWFRFPVCEQPHGMHAYLDLCVSSDREEFSLSETEAYRLYCQIMVQHLPASAFAEAVESLSQIFEFYLKCPGALPAPATFPSVKVTITGSHTAPVYPITED